MFAAVRFVSCAGRARAKDDQQDFYKTLHVLPPSAGRLTSFASVNCGRSRCRVPPLWNQVAVPSFPRNQNRGSIQSVIHRDFDRNLSSSHSNDTSAVGFS